MNVRPPGKVIPVHVAILILLGATVASAKPSRPAGWRVGVPANDPRGADLLPALGPTRSLDIPERHSKSRAGFRHVYSSTDGVLELDLGTSVDEVFSRTCSSTFPIPTPRPTATLLPGQPTYTPTNTATPTHTKVPTAPVSDFPVNNQTLGNQERPKVAAGAAGDFVVTWQDKQSDTDIMMRRFDSAGAPLGNDRLVNQFTAGPQTTPVIGRSSNGNFVIAWTSRDAGYSGSKVALRRFASNGQPLAGEEVVPTTASTANDEMVTEVAVGADGRFIVVYRRTPANSGGFVQRYDSNGAAVGSAIKVSNFADERATGAMGPGGQFLIAWASSTFVQARLYSSQGTLIGTEFHVSEDTSFSKSATSTTADPQGNFVVAWEDYGHDGDSIGIFARRVNSSGSPLAHEFQVNTTTASAQFWPDVAADGNGDFAVVWSSVEQDGSLHGIIGQAFQSNGARLGTEFQVNTHTEGYQTAPSLSFDGPGRFVAVWQDGYPAGLDGSGWGVFGQHVSLPTAVPNTPTPKPTAPVTDFQVNGSTSQAQRYPQVAVGADGDFLVAWQNDDAVDFHGVESDVRVRRFDSAGVPIGADLQVNETTAGRQVRPVIGRSASGDFAIAWKSDQDGGFGSGIFVRRFGSNGQPLAGEEPVGLTASTASDDIEPWLGMDADGNFVIVYVRVSNPEQPADRDLLAQRFDSAGAPVGSEIAVSTGSNGPPNVAMGPDGSFLVTWAAADGVHGVLYDSSGRGASDPFQINQDTALDKRRPAAAADSDGDFVVSWTSNLQDGDDGSIVARRLDSAGNRLANEFQVNATARYKQDFSAIAADSDGDFLILWESWAQDGSQLGVFGQAFLSNGTRFGAEFQVNTHTEGSQVEPSVGFDGQGRFVAVWQDGVNGGDGLDGSSWGVFAQRRLFAALETPIPASVLLGAIAIGLGIIGLRRRRRS